MKPSIETSSPNEIAHYLKSLKDIAYNKACADSSVKNSSDSSVWEKLYNFVFSEEISHVIVRRFNFSWYDPDTTYYEDVTSFIDQFCEEYLHEEKERKF